MKFLKLPKEEAMPRAIEEVGEGEERENGHHRSDDYTISLSQLSTLSDQDAATDAKGEGSGGAEPLPRLS